MENWNINIYRSFFVANIITFLIYMNTSGETALGALISTYCLLTINILLTLILFSISIHFLLMLAITGFILYMLIYYKDKISANQVSNSFYVFTNISFILIFINNYINYEAQSNSKLQENSKMQKYVGKISLILGIFAGVCSAIMFTILHYFTTDGFTTQQE